MANCSVRWAADLYDRASKHKLDLEARLPRVGVVARTCSFAQLAASLVPLQAHPTAAPAELREVHGTFDVAVSHQALSQPNSASLQRDLCPRLVLPCTLPAGSSLGSAPHFAQVFEHLARPAAGIANVNALLKIGGALIFSTPFLLLDQPTPRDYSRYTVQNVHRLLECGGFEPRSVRGAGNALSTLAYLTGVSPGELSPHDLEGWCEGRGCAMQHYIMVAATAIKRRSVDLADVTTCYA